MAQTNFSLLRAVYLQSFACGFLFAICPLNSHSADAVHIVVTKEVLLEAAQPKAIARAPDGGYVIAGYHDYSAWATKVDKNGKVIWRHELLGASTEPCCQTEYRGIALLKDGTVLLCGVLDATLEGIDAGRRYRTPHILGLITRVNARGEITSKETLTAPQLTAAGELEGMNNLDKCAATNDGAIVVGSGFRLSGAPTGRRISYFSWLVGLNRNGKVESSNVLSAPFPPDQGRASIRDLIAFPAGDFMFIAPSQGAIRFKKDGEIESSSNIDVPILLTSGVEEPVRSISAVDSSDAEMMDLDKNTAEPRKGKSAEFQRSWAYRLSDGSIALFGSTLLYGGTAAAEWISADSKTYETKVFMPTHGAGQIDAVAPTARRDEFATVRLVIPGLRHKVGPDETRSGILLTFLRFQ